MHKFEYKATNLRKNYIKNIDIFSKLDLEFSNNDIVGLIGDNGSGKSTLLKILAGVLSPSNGNIELKIDNIKIERNNWNKYYTFVAPYINLYEEFTPLEHYKIIANIRNIQFNEKKLDEDLKYFKLFKQKYSQIKSFSSGMKQRYKFILALQAEPSIIFLDEPTSNLDLDGISKVVEFVEQFNKNGAAIIIATNEERERVLCNKFYNIMEYK